MPPLPCRLIVDPPADGAWNMAVDDALLEAAALDGVASLRFYQWSEPTLSLGYFQAYADRERHEPSRGCPCVRRHSGGGAILHDIELTYSLAVPATRAYARDPQALYLAAHESLAAVLRRFVGPTAAERIALRGEQPTTHHDEPLLCFERCAKGDLLAREIPPHVAQDSQGWRKIAGSSQRKRRAVILQHGSVLVARSPRAPELPGIADVLGAAPEVEWLIDQWTPRIAAAAGLAVESRGLPAGAADCARRLAGEKFAQAAWLTRR